MEAQSPEGDYMVGELIEKIIEDGIAEVNKFRVGVELDGALEGFEMARQLPATYEDFDWVVTQREEEEEKLRHINDGVSDEEATERFWRHRWATLQLEFCRNILLVAKVASGHEVPPDTRLSARAVRKYANIVGVAQKNED